VLRDFTEVGIRADNHLGGTSALRNRFVLRHPGLMPDVVPTAISMLYGDVRDNLILSRNDAAPIGGIEGFPFALEGNVVSSAAWGIRVGGESCRTISNNVLLGAPGAAGGHGLVIRGCASGLEVRGNVVSGFARRGVLISHSEGILVWDNDFRGQSSG